MTPDTIAACTGAKVERARIYAPALTKAMGDYGIHTAAQQAMFLAQVGHETGRLLWLAEIWGPTPAQVGYEGRADLGNTQPGDGFKFRGRGMFQCTGRANYTALRDRLRARYPLAKVPDFAESPDLVAQAEWASLSAGDYWASRNLNPLADAGAIVLVTKRINGGLNGLAERTALWEAARKTLGA